RWASAIVSADPRVLDGDRRAVFGSVRRGVLATKRPAAGAVRRRGGRGDRGRLDGRAQSVPRNRTASGAERGDRARDRRRSAPRGPLAAAQRAGARVDAGGPRRLVRGWLRGQLETAARRVGAVRAA